MSYWPFYVFAAVVIGACAWSWYRMLKEPKPSEQPNAAPPVPASDRAAADPLGASYVDAVCVFPKPRPVTIGTNDGLCRRNIVAVEREQPYNRLHFLLDKPIPNPMLDVTGHAARISFTVTSQCSFSVSGNAVRSKSARLREGELFFVHDDARGHSVTIKEAWAEADRPLAFMLGPPPCEKAS